MAYMSILLNDGRKVKISVGSRKKKLEIISALEKQIPKPPTKTKNSTLLCPNCGEYVGYVDAEVDIRADYCNFCGQAIDWRSI